MGTALDFDLGGQIHLGQIQLRLETQQPFAPAGKHRSDGAQGDGMLVVAVAVRSKSAARLRC